MSYYVIHRMGSMTRDYPLEKLDVLYGELADSDVEHQQVALVHESEWGLTALEDGLLIWENLEEDSPRHMKEVPREKVLTLWRLLAGGDLDAVEREPWLPGDDLS